MTRLKTLLKPQCTAAFALSEGSVDGFGAFAGASLSDFAGQAWAVVHQISASEIKSVWQFCR